MNHHNRYHRYHRYHIFGCMIVISGRDIAVDIDDLVVQLGCSYLV
jgi:hypothetical protein